MTVSAARASGPKLPASTIHLARALVLDAKRHGRRQEPAIEAVARMEIPEDDQRS